MRLQALALVYVAVSTALKFETRSNLHACPLLGQEYPSPIQIKDEATLQAAGRSLDATLNEKVKKAPYKETTFSLGMFSTSDDGLVYQYHHTSNAVANSSYGTNNVDANSVYRIGSVSKLLTMYTWLIQDGDRRFNHPVADYLPQLLKYSADSWNSVTPDWEEITIGDLAGQMAGLARDYGLADLALKNNGLISLPASLQKGFPNIPQAQLPKCGYEASNGTWLICSEDEYLSGVASESPIFSTAYTPVYSNEAFAILGLALSKITGSSMEVMFNESLVKSLSLSSTYYSVPSEITDHDVIPGTPLKSGWNAEFGLFGPAGGYFSTLNDFATLGKAMLTSRLLPAALTRRWMKVSSFVESWDAGVGRPWEIFRLKVNGQSVDIYSKSGDWGVYHSTIALIPTYNVGFTSFTAGNELVRNELPGVLTHIMMPALDQIAKDQTRSRFAGHYASAKANSSLTLTTNGDDGLKITQWINNGVNVMETLTAEVPNLVWRMLPNQLYDDEDRIGFSSFYESASPPPAKGDPFFACPGWFDVDELTYGNIPLGQMTFSLGSSGKATAVELRALRTTLERQS